MLNHIILFNYSHNVKDNNEESEAFELLKASVLTLLDISYVIDAKIYLNEANSSDLVFYVKIEDKEALKLYLKDPIHIAHANRVNHLVERIEVIDFKD